MSQPKELEINIKYSVKLRNIKNPLKWADFKEFYLGNN